MSDHISEEMTYRAETVYPELLVPFEEHPRPVPDVGEQLVKSVRRQGIVEPPICRESDDGLRIVDGVRRVEAAERAGVSDLPVLVTDVSVEDALAMFLSAHTGAFTKSVSGSDRERSLERIAGETGKSRVEVQVDLGAATGVDLLRERIGGVTGVGESVLEALTDHFDEPGEVERADDQTLQNVDGVGPKLANRINRALSDGTEAIVHGR